MRRRQTEFEWPPKLTEFVEDDWLDTPLTSISGWTAKEWLVLYAGELKVQQLAIWRGILAWDGFAHARQEWLEEHHPDVAIDWFIFSISKGHKMRGALHELSEREGR